MLPRWGGWGLRSGGAVADVHLAAVIRVASRTEILGLGVLAMTTDIQRCWSAHDTMETSSTVQVV